MTGQSQESHRKEVNICTESKSDDVTSVCHPAMPCISGIQLGRWSDVQQDVSQRGLQGVECEVQEIKRDDSDSDGGVGDLKVALHGVESGSAITKDY